ncbi:t-RNA-processing ribonuclease BN [Kozakia baliensis NRIC 0488]|nr:t-RNA-processing ribonuclease BN [Kozakia baliensis NRIC 0488]GEL65329.1 ribonuclease [Kozakia baliensis]
MDESPPPQQAVAEPNADTDRVQDAATQNAEAAAKNAPGTGAKTPLHMPPAGWKLVFRQTINEAGSSQTSLAAAGCAFYATLSLFPAISALISVYGLAFDLQTVEPQLNVLRNLLPPAAFSLIADQIHSLISQPHSSLTIGLIFSFTIALWSASASTKSVLSALNLAYDVQETRGFFSFQLIALGVTLGAVLGACLTLALMVALPALVDYLPHLASQFGLRNLPPIMNVFMSYSAPYVVHFGAPALMLFFIFAAVTLLFRYGPCRTTPSWRWIFPGSLVATVLWVLTSIGFSYYVSRFASYGSTYGPLGAVAAIMMWFFVSTYVVLFGAELNAGLEDRMNGLAPRNSTNSQKIPDKDATNNIQENSAPQRV